MGTWNLEVPGTPLWAEGPIFWDIPTKKASGHSPGGAAGFHVWETLYGMQFSIITLVFIIIRIGYLRRNR
jgi:hypothetical protein